MSGTKDLNGLSRSVVFPDSPSEDMNSLFKDSWSGESNPSPSPRLPFNYSLEDSKSVLTEPACWAYRPLPRLGLQPSSTTFSDCEKTMIPTSSQSHHQLMPPPSITTHRSVSFSDQHGSEYGSPSHGLKYRERVSSLPTAPHHSSLQEQMADHQFQLVDDIFPNVTPEPIETPITQYQTMIGAEAATISKKDKASSRGWLEVSIDCTMPTSPVLRKDTFNFGSLQDTLPSSPTSKSMLQKRVNISPPASGTAASIAIASPVDSNCLVKKLLPLPTDETYSRKVFIGGLPPDIDQEEIRMSFQKYGSVTIDWPHKIHSKSRVPPKGYAFLLFKDEGSVHKLLACCVTENDKLFAYIKYYVTGTSITRKKCQIRPWKITDSYYFANEDKKVDNRKAVFVGGVPRPLKARELAEVMTEKFGPVSFVAIDCDTELKYPKGAACVVFATHASYIASVSSRFMQLVFGALEKKVEVKPYILEDQLCDECNGIQSDGQPAPFFCGSVTCLKYYCEHCWATFHSLSGRQNHRPMFKDIFDRDKFS
ncbi:PREDICTED: cytoplasmic polyadenylation element-binding protein 1-like isoform X2 [Amphimedon queenslandica]|uniref:RRM domain-containing protein n=1 Tax=Amphimedon queenslandica TaxID=400682 RepID=A0A1X7VR64_AMPQE|nr:PREDICTED: cytoplasmic polyadenylation element-binding protein 1-like isoform X2 [Amphimedon queenslandica]|eukprot:XP_019858923.1 PREDICTED: cytoplasmic polyadenylation element-binding protein 1-like isoform X2 [Amphimedon queenslandica]